MMLLMALYAASTGPVLELLDAPERCQVLGAAARNTVLEQYTWSRQAVAFARILEQAARAGRE